MGRTISRKLCQPEPPETIAASSSSSPNWVQCAFDNLNANVMLEINVARTKSDIEP